jgi:malonyl CoA-acyl carrier protein transacylase
MSPVDLIAANRAIEALLALIANAGVSVAKINAMRDMSASGHLTDDQIGQLVVDAHESVRRLG